MRRLISLIAACALPVFACAQPAATGRIIVATPALEDPNFTETVILLVHHGEDGSLGLFLNRPTWVDGAESFPALASLDERERTLYLGGPVQMTQLLVLTAGDEAGEGVTPILDGVQLTADLTRVTETPQRSDGRLRIFAGHAAWAAGRLQAEIEDGYWRVIDGSAALVFSDAPDELWRLAGRIAESELVVRFLPPRSGLK